MSDSEKDPLSGLLSSFALGPAWARAAGSGEKELKSSPGKRQERSPRRDDRGPDDRKGGFRGRDDDRRPQRGRGGRFDDRRSGPPRDVEAPPAVGVRVTLMPDAEAVHLIGREVHQVARVYPLFDVAKILLAERKRCRAVFEAPEPHAPLLRGKLEEALFLTREEAAGFLWRSEFRGQLMEEEIIEVDPPKGNFQSVARCGLSGELLGPPNFHAYQINLRRLHRERFPNMPFEAYSAKVRSERGEEAVNAWLETMKQKTRWRIIGDADDAWIEDRTEAERALASRCFDKAFEEVRSTEVLASIAATHLSPSLMTSLKLAGNHARNHPAILIPAVCRAIEAEHLPVFKRQGKLLTGPARPHPLPVGAVLAERPGIMVEWIRANKPARLEGLWKAVLPEGSTAPPAEYAADLFWLLHQGHILLYTDDTLYVQEVREAGAGEKDGDAKPAKKKKKRSKKAKPEGGTPLAGDAGVATGETVSEATELTLVKAPLVEAPTVESPVVEAPVVEGLVIEAPVSEAPTAESPAVESPAETIPVPEPPVVEGPVVETAVSESSVSEETSVEITTADEPESSGPVPEIEAAEEISKKPSPGVDDTPGL